MRVLAIYGVLEGLTRSCADGEGLRVAAEELEVARNQGVTESSKRDWSTFIIRSSALTSPLTRASS
jgi:hypothetical protein